MHTIHTYIPALDHDVVYGSGAARWWGESEPTLNLLHGLQHANTEDVEAY